MEQGRKLLFKEGPETISATQRKLKMLYFIRMSINISFHLFAAYSISKTYLWINDAK